MIFRRSKKTVKKGALGIDKVVTGIIIGGAAASIFWLSRTKKWKHVLQRLLDNWEGILKWGVRVFWKITLEFLSWFQKKK